ncbi:DEAD-box ATP-dependent RNA helicase [Trifolium repens]|nr:DEAD-box ATP-dependent RNA helicase [Trifolium repens]
MGTTKNTKTKIIKNKQNDKKTIADGTNKETKSDNNGVFASCSFSSLGLHQTLCGQLHERMGFEGPTLVQAQAIPVVLSGRHAYPFFLIFTACFDTVILLNL